MIRIYAYNKLKIQMKQIYNLSCTKFLMIKNYKINKFNYKIKKLYKLNLKDSEF